MFESPTLPPHCSYVERGGASPAATKRSSSWYLTTPDNETSSGTPSTQRLIDGTEGSHGSQNQVPTNTRTSQTNKRKIEHFGPRRKKRTMVLLLSSNSTKGGTRYLWYLAWREWPKNPTNNGCAWTELPERISRYATFWGGKIARCDRAEKHENPLSP